MQLIAMRVENVESGLVGFAQQLLHFLIDEVGGLIAEVSGFLNLFAEEDVFFADAKRHGANGVAHAPMGDHVAGQFGRLFQVAFDAGVGLLEHEPFRRPASHQHCEIGLEEIKPVMDAILVGLPPGHAAGFAAWDDADLLRRIALEQHPADERMARFVVGSSAAVIFTENLLALVAQLDAVGGSLEIDAFQAILDRKSVV